MEERRRVGRDKESKMAKVDLKLIIDEDSFQECKNKLKELRNIAIAINNETGLALQRADALEATLKRIGDRQG